MQEQFKDILNINDQMLYEIAHNIASVPLILEELEATLLHLSTTLPHVFETCEDLKTLLDKYKELHPICLLAQGDYPYINHNKNIIHIFCFSMVTYIKISGILI